MMHRHDAIIKQNKFYLPAGLESSLAYAIASENKAAMVANHLPSSNRLKNS